MKCVVFLIFNRIVTFLVFHIVCCSVTPLLPQLFLVTTNLICYESPCQGVCCGALFRGRFVLPLNSKLERPAMVVLKQ